MISRFLTTVICMFIGALLMSSCTSQRVQSPTSIPKPTQNDTNFQSPPLQTIKTDRFEEITIPYLRTREYSSTLEEPLLLADNGTFISYLTSYQSDGLKINALLTQPKEKRPQNGWPAIVFVHGYIPPNQYRTTEKYVDYVNYLARNRFVVLKIDLRGHGSSEGEAGGGYYSSDYVIDTLNARAALQSTDFVDPDKVGLWGHSMAGNVTLRSLAASPDIPAIAIWGGAGFTYTDLREYRIQDNSYRPQPSDTESQKNRRELFEKHGQFDPNSEFWKKVVPTNYLEDIRGAVGLFHAQDDDVVSIRYSQNLNNILEQTTIQHEFHSYPSGGHNINGANFTTAMRQTVEFYNKYLLN